MKANEVVNKKFSRRIGGYDQKEVDSFLDEVMMRMEEMEDELEAKSKRAESFDKLEEEVMSIILTAQKNAGIYVSNAEAQAQNILNLAMDNADSIIRSAIIRLDNVKNEAAKYEKLIADYNRGYTAFLEDQYNKSTANVQSIKEISAHKDEMEQAISELKSRLSTLKTEKEMIQKNIKSEAERMQNMSRASVNSLGEKLDELIEEETITDTGKKRKKDGMEK